VTLSGVNWAAMSHDFGMACWGEGTCLSLGSATLHSIENEQPREATNKRPSTVICSAANSTFYDDISAYLQPLRVFLFETITAPAVERMHGGGGCGASREGDQVF
jgi:hypothetical protein